MSSARVRGVDLYYEAHGSGSSHLIIAHGALGSVRHAELLGVRAASLAALGFPSASAGSFCERQRRSTSTSQQPAFDSTDSLPCIAGAEQR